jgi:hypothetical protein
MPQSPETAGGEGFTFEGDAAAFYLAALLAEAYAPGIDNRTVVRVSVQQRDFGEPLDDVIVDFEDAAKNPARLSLQVKRSLTISKAKTNTDFRDIIRDSWATLKKPDFRINIDRYGTAVGTVTPAKERALKTICDWARESLTADHFDTRFAKGGAAPVRNEKELRTTSPPYCTRRRGHRAQAKKCISSLRTSSSSGSTSFAKALLIPLMPLIASVIALYSMTQPQHPWSGRVPFS